MIEGNGFTLAAANLSPGDLLERLHAYGLRTWRIGEGSLTPARPEELQPETVADYLASRAAPPWPATPARTDDEIAATLSAEARHPMWTHRRYVAGVLATAPDTFMARPEVRDTIEQLLIDHDAQRSRRPHVGGCGDPRAERCAPSPDRSGRWRRGRVAQRTRAPRLIDTTRVRADRAPGRSD